MSLLFLAQAFPLRQQPPVVPGKLDMPSPSAIAVVIAVSVRLYREGLATALGTRHSLVVQEVAGTSHEAHVAVEKFRPDVVIVDVSLDDVLVLMRRIKESAPTRILAFAVREDIAAILDCAAAGADGFVTTNGSITDLVEAIERTAAGELLCSPSIAAQLLRRAAQHGHAERDDAEHAPLTSREQQVLDLIQQGRSNKEIGSALNIAEATVKNHVHHVLEKLRVSTRAQAMATGTRPLKARVDPRPSSRRAS